MFMVEPVVIFIVSEVYCGLHSPSFTTTICCPGLKLVRIESVLPSFHKKEKGGILLLDVTG